MDDIIIKRNPIILPIGLILFLLITLYSLGSTLLQTMQTDIQQMKQEQSSFASFQNNVISSLSEYHANVISYYPISETTQGSYRGDVNQNSYWVIITDRKDFPDPMKIDYNSVKITPTDTIQKTQVRFKHLDKEVAYQNTDYKVGKGYYSVELLIPSRKTS